MADLFGFLFIIDIFSLILGVIKPSIFQKIFKSKILTRKFILKIFGISAIVLLILIGIFAEPVVKQDNQEAESNIKLKLYPVTQVVDGDTIKVNLDGQSETIRLIGIDTPETVDPRKVVQCFGLEASNKAKELLSGKQVGLEADSTQGERDKYNRLLRYVILEDGTSFNKLMIAEGYAHEYTYQSNPYIYQTDFKAAENNARAQGLGLWNVNACNGDTVQAASDLKSEGTVVPVPASNVVDTRQEQTINLASPNLEDGLTPQVKKSTNDICHEKGTTYYTRTKNFEPFNSIDECLASGGRLPK